MYCTRCGSKIDEGARFCTVCGAPVRQPDATSVPAASPAAPASETMPTVDTAADPCEVWASEAPVMLAARFDGDAAGAPREEGSVSGDALDTSVNEYLAAPDRDADAIADGDPEASAEGDAAPESTASASPDAVAADRETVPYAPTHAAVRPREHHRTARRRVVLAVAGVLVVGCGAAGIFTVSGGFTKLAAPVAAGSAAQTAEPEPKLSVDFAPRAAAYLTQETQRVAPSAPIIPAGDDGRPLAHYTVRVKDAIDGESAGIDVSSVAALEIGSTDGFTVQGLLGDNPVPGTYYLVIERDDRVQLALPPLEVASDASADALGVVRDPTAPLGADTLFLAKLREVEDAYGAPDTELQNVGSEVHLSATGLSYAELMDFGDGVERLLVAYNTGDNHDAYGVPNPESYNIEVWRYDAEADALVCCVGADPLLHPSVTDTISISSLANGTNIMWFERLVDGGTQMTYYGLDDAGTFRLLHTLVSTNDPGHTMILDGEDIGPADPDDIWDGMFTNSYQVGGRYISFTNAFASRAEAERGEPSDSPGIAVSGDGTYYPRAAVDRASRTVEELQGCVDALGAARPGAVDGQQDAAGVSGSEVCETVSVPTYEDGTDGAAGSADYTWGCLELTADPDAVDADIVARVNERLRAAYDDEKRATLSWEPGASAAECLSYRSALTYNKGSVLGTRVQMRRTSWTGRAMLSMSSVVFELETGDPIPTWEVADTSEERLDAAAVDALVAYVRAHPSGVTYASDDELRQAAEEIVRDATYLLVPEGITLFLPEYAMGYPYSSGAKEIVVWAFNDESLVGTDVSASYFLHDQ